MWGDKLGIFSKSPIFMEQKGLSPMLWVKMWEAAQGNKQQANPCKAITTQCRWGIEHNITNSYNWLSETVLHQLSPTCRLIKKTYQVHANELVNWSNQNYNHLCCGSIEPRATVSSNTRISIGTCRLSFRSARWSISTKIYQKRNVNFPPLYWSGNWVNYGWQPGVEWSNLYRMCSRARKTAFITIYWLQYWIKEITGVGGNRCLKKKKWGEPKWWPCCLLVKMQWIFPCKFSHLNGMHKIILILSFSTDSVYVFDEGTKFRN